MRKTIAAAWLVVGIAALIGLLASLLGADLGEGGRPMLFARALVICAGGFVVTLRWRVLGGSRRGQERNRR